MKTFSANFNQRLSARRCNQGVTMVELLVAMVLMGLVTLATVSLYSVTSQSYKTVDASQELSDNARYAFEVIGQSLRIAGYQEYLRNNPNAPTLAGRIYPAICVSAVGACPIIGFNNSTIGTVSSDTDFGTTNSGGINASDTLGATFSGASVPSDLAVADNAILDCQGVARPSPVDATDLGLSLFWVVNVSGEPSLSCISRGATRNSQPIVRGVETFQVMYGIDIDGDSLPNRWVSAQDVTDWMLVRAVRIGFVLRGPVGSGQRQAGATTTTAERTYYPLGKDFIGASTEAGLTFTAPDDGRIRRAFSTTYMLRNSF